MTALECALHDKIKGIALGDYKYGLQCLELVFERRKRVAKLILGRDYPGINFIELCNEEIKKVLYL
jgi:hypothetical protein